MKKSGNSGTVRVGDIPTFTFTGGVVGRNMNGAIVEKSYNTGDVSGKSNVGDIVGYDDGIVLNCFNFYMEDIKTTYNHITEKINIEIKKYNVNTNAEFSYQWYTYDCETNKGIEIIGATDKEYSIPTDLNVGRSYYYAHIGIQWQNETGEKKSFMAKSNIGKVMIDKANPILPQISTLEATYGQTLGEVELPKGFSWKHEEDTLVGELGKNTFLVKYTPEDIKNYHIIENIEVNVQVEKGIPHYEIPSNLRAIYGQALRDVELPEGFNWQNETNTLVGDVGENIFLATYTPKDTINYKEVADIQVAIKVSKAPTEFTYVNKDNISGIIASGLEEKINIPEKEQQDIEKVTIGIQSSKVNKDSPNAAIIKMADEFLKKQKYNLLEAFHISIVKRVVRIDGIVEENKIPNNDIMDFITIRIPISEKYSDKSNLAVVFVDDEGYVEILHTKVVNIKGEDYLEFKTDHFSIYAIVEFLDFPTEEIRESGAKEYNEMKDNEVEVIDNFEFRNLPTEEIKESDGKGFNQITDIEVSATDKVPLNHSFHEELGKIHKEEYNKVDDIKISQAEDAKVPVITNLLSAANEEEETKETSIHIYYIIGVVIIVAGILFYGNRKRKDRES